MPDAIKKSVSISAWKVPSADTFTKKHVSANDNLLIKKVKAQAAWTMTGHVIDAQRCPKQLARSVFLEKKIGCERIDFQLKSHPAEEFTVVNHRGGSRMKSGLASVALDYCCSIDDMIEVSMGEKQQVDLFVSEGGIRPLRGIEKNSALRRLIVKAIGVEYTAGEAFEPIH